MKREIAERLMEFEAVWATPLKDEFERLSADEKVELIVGFASMVKEYADANGLPHPDRKTWESYKKIADWKQVAKELKSRKSFFGKVKKRLDKLSYLW